ncbi:MAG: glycosyltransferase [Bacteroidota bacterium]
MTKSSKTILVAPLNWGLGHATRCIPIIKQLQLHKYNVLLGSDGPALMLLRKEFPQLPFVELPDYQIVYPKSGALFKWKLLTALPQIQAAVSSEKKIIKKLVKAGRIHGIISDNRLGVRNKKVPSVFMTHQLNVLSGNTSLFSSKVHQKFIKKFDQCWVPDAQKIPNLSGKLGHPKKRNFPVTYVGPLSRMKKEEVPIKYDILALLSGPEPQRTLLEEKLMEVFIDQPKKVLLVRGVLEEESRTSVHNNITVVNFMQTKELERAINASELVVSRSGYTTIMDLAALEKEAYFIPTPGQYEQKYLAKQLRQKGIVPSCRQDKFQLNKLAEVEFFKGLRSIKSEIDFGQLFSLFERK